MQDENKTIQDFVRRTDDLAYKTGLNLSELPKIIGISKAMLFAYRSGKQAISAKVWRKLYEAQVKASEKSDFERNKGEPYYSTIPKWSPDSIPMQDDVAKYRFTPQRPPLADHDAERPEILMMEKNLEAIYAQLDSMKAILETMKRKL